MRAWFIKNQNKLALGLLGAFLGFAVIAGNVNHDATATSAAPAQPQGCVSATTSTIESFAGANAVVPKIEVTNHCQAAVDVDLKFGLFWLRDGKQSFEWTFKDLRPGRSYEQEWFDHQFDKYLSTFRLTASSYAEITCQKSDSPDQCKTVLACEREQTVDFCERGYGVASSEAQIGGVSTPPPIASDGRQ